VQPMIYTAALLLFLLGMYGLLTRKNLIKMAVCFNIMEASLLIFLIALAYREGGRLPIVEPGREAAYVYVDPLPHALALTAIVIGASTTAMMLALIVKLYKRYGTLNVDELRRLRG